MQIKRSRAFNILFFHITNLCLPIVKGHEKVIDKDATTEYLFINAPRDIYTVYFDSSMPIFGKNVFDGCEESSSLELNMQDRKICFYCPTSVNGEVIDGATYNVTSNVELLAIWEDIPHNHDYGTTWESDTNNHWNECSCGDKANVGTHADSDNNGKRDTCDYQMGNGGALTPDEPKDGLSGGAIAGIVVGSVVVLGLGGFALVWFVIKKKSFADIIEIFKKK